MPDELAALQEQIGSHAGERDHKKAILERLKQIRDFLRFSRFRPVKGGSVLTDADAASQGGEPGARPTLREGSKEPGKKGGRTGDIYALFAEAGAIPAEPLDIFNEPKTQC